MENLTNKAAQEALENIGNTVVIVVMRTSPEVFIRFTVIVSVFVTVIQNLEKRKRMWLRVSRDKKMDVFK